ncbi:MAG: hypothetical protein HYY13_09895 [Nitrospirae bacterium]|nr:hypothetical protein [Nitrospirota bacterium]
MPAPISDLTLFEEADAILLTWSVPSRNINRWRLNDLAGFKVLRKVDVGEFEVVADVPFDEELDRLAIKRIRYREPKTRSVSGPTETAPDSQAGVPATGEAPAKEVVLRYKVVSINESGYASADSNIVSLTLPPPAHP